MAPLSNTKKSDSQQFTGYAPNSKTGSGFEVTDGTKQVGGWNDGSNTQFPTGSFRASIPFGPPLVETLARSVAAALERVPLPPSLASGVCINSGVKLH
jgi:hypothetical protein